MVFQDPSGARWKMVRAVATAVVLVGLLLLADLLAGIFTAPALPRLEAAIFPSQKAGSELSADTRWQLQLRPTINPPTGPTMASLASPSLSSQQRCPAAAAPISCKP